MGNTRLPRHHRAILRTAPMMPGAPNHRLVLFPDVKAIWHQVPKVGSSSIWKALSAQAEVNWEQLHGKALLPSWMYKDWTAFAFVRSPEQRLLSAWRDKVLRSNLFGFSPATHAKMHELDAFLDWLEDQDLRLAEPHIRWQSALFNPDRMDFIGRMENIQKDWRELAQRLELPRASWDLPHINASTFVQPLSSVREDQTLRILRLYAPDVQNFYPDLANAPNSRTSAFQDVKGA